MTTTKTATFVIDARGLFTAHKDGCAHLRLAGDAVFDIASDPTRGSVRQELDDMGFEDSGLDFAPCLDDLPE